MKHLIKYNEKLESLPQVSKEEMSYIETCFNDCFSDYMADYGMEPSFSYGLYTNELNFIHSSLWKKRKNRSYELFQKLLNLDPKKGASISLHNHHTGPGDRLTIYLDENSNAEWVAASSQFKRLLEDRMDIIKFESPTELLETWWTISIIIVF